MSPAAVAREIGLSNSSTTTWKHGALPKGETLEILADYFGTTTDYLLCRTDDPENSDRFGLDPPELWDTNNLDSTSISLDESSQVLVALGLIKEGEDLSDVDLAFLANTIQQLDLWFSNRHSRSAPPESPPAPQEGKDTTQPPAAPTEAPEGE